MLFHQELQQFLAKKHFSFHQRNGRKYTEGYLMVFLTELEKSDLIILQKKSGC